MSENEHKELACTGVDVVDVASDIARFASMGLLPQLLANHSTGGNIVWASSVFVDKGDSYAPTDEILVSDITGDNAGLIRTRASKAREAQVALTRAHAEVFTPTWIVDKMVDEADKAWDEAHPSATWRDYVLSPRLEITCGEVPYLVSRYDAADGKPVPVGERVGILDRKLSRIPHYFKRRSWMTWATNAVKSTYGYEFQGDNLLIARVNMLVTIEDYARDAGHAPLTPSEYRKFVDIISWNLWQMDGLSDCVPFGNADAAIEVEYTPTLFDVDEYTVPSYGIQLMLFDEKRGDGLARVYDWVSDKEILFQDIKRGGCDMRFDYVIGNPPYQEETTGDSNTAKPIYHRFMDAVYELSDRAMLITPARFLFNAGYTPKPWNRKMLDDPHFKVVYYNPNAAEVFSGVDIKGGVAITYRDVKQDFGAIGTFTRFPMLNKVLRTVTKQDQFSSLKDIIVTSFAYHFTETMYDENPSLKGRGSRGHAYDLQSNTFDTYPEIFFETRPVDGDYIRILGRVANARGWRYVKRDYVTDVSNLGAYKAFYPKAAGTGQFGETLPEPVFGNPGDGATVTYLSIGQFDTEEESRNCVRYLKTRFARTMLGIMKVTQDMTPAKFEYVPLQDFTSESDIDWSQSISEIDDQLFEKYGLEDDEVEFIKTHVKEMS